MAFSASGPSRMTHTEFLPKSLIAGSLPLGKGASPTQVAYNSASLALNTERLCLITSVLGNRVYYLAGDASEFASQQNASTVLSTALPGSRMHRGDGVYFALLSDKGQMACIVVKDKTLKCFVGAPAEAERFPAVENASDLPVYHLHSTGEKFGALTPWRQLSDYDRDENRKLAKAILSTGAANALVMATVWVACSFYVAQASEQSSDYKAMAEAMLSEASASLARSSSSRHMGWQELQDVSRFAREHKGRIQAFELKDGRISWQLEIPTFVTGEQISKAFKGGVQTRKDGPVIIVSKAGAV